MPCSTRIDGRHQAPVNDYHILSDDVRLSKIGVGGGGREGGGKKSQSPPGALSTADGMKKESLKYGLQTCACLFHARESPAVKEDNLLGLRRLYSHALKQFSSLFCLQFRESAK